MAVSHTREVGQQFAVTANASANRSQALRKCATPRSLAARFPSTNGE
jgi:hypothetical protein